MPGRPIPSAAADGGGAKPVSRPARAAHQRPLTIELLWAPDMLEGPAAAAIDVAVLVNMVAAQRGLRGAPVAWQWTAPDGRALRRLPAGGTRSRRVDVLLVPGWAARNGPHMNRLVARDRAACERLRAVHAAGGQVLALYTGVALLGEAGLLDGRPAAVPWPFLTASLRHAPTLLPAKEDAWVVQDRVWTADSPVLATELVLRALAAAETAGHRCAHQADGRGGAAAATRRAAGRQEAPANLADLAEAARSVLLHSAERQRLAVAASAHEAARVGPGALERARRWLEDHLHEPYSLADTARAAAASPRSLLRHFRVAFGCTPLQMLHRLRVVRARMLLETTYLPVEAVAERCGWNDVSMLRTAFRRATGTTPAAYRERFRLRTERRRWGDDLPRGGEGGAGA